MRVSHLQSNVLALKALGPAEEAQIRKMAADEIAQIEDSVRVAWLPLALDVVLTEAVGAVCGEERLRQWGRDAIVKSGEGPLLRPFFSALRRVGLTPHAALKAVPYGWKVVYENCGEVRYKNVSETEGAIVHENVPMMMHQSLAYLIGTAGALDGAMAIVGDRSATATVEVIEPNAVNYACRWRADL